LYSVALLFFMYFSCLNISLWWQVGKKKNSNVPAGLFFQHAGHRYDAVGESPLNKGPLKPERGLCGLGHNYCINQSLFHSGSNLPQMFSLLLHGG
jgi:hypothetical protein